MVLKLVVAGHCFTTAVFVYIYHTSFGVRNAFEVRFFWYFLYNLLLKSEKKIQPQHGFSYRTSKGYSYKTSKGYFKRKLNKNSVNINLRKLSVTTTTHRFHSYINRIFTFFFYIFNTQFTSNLYKYKIYQSSLVLSL
jgi:hypothetical protein